MEEAETLKKDRRAPERRCIVSREVLPKDQLIRFVVGPEDMLVPDVGGKLPGRGYWVCCDKAALEQALSQQLFHKVAKTRVRIPDNLMEQTEGLLKKRALQSIALANKSGSLVQGFDKVLEALKADQVIALIHADDASEASLHKLKFEVSKRFGCFSAQELSEKLGAEHAVHLALLEGKAGQAALKEIRRFTGFLKS